MAARTSRPGSPAARVYWTKRINNSRLVRQRDPGYLRETALLVGTALVSLGIVLLCAWQHFLFLQAGYRLEELRARHEQVLEWNRTLQLEQAALLDPMRIDLLARTQLGLNTPQPSQLIPLGADRRPLETPLLARLPASGAAAGVGAAENRRQRRTPVLD